MPGRAFSCIASGVCALGGLRDRRGMPRGPGLQPSGPAATCPGADGGGGDARTDGGAAGGAVPGGADALRRRAPDAPVRSASRRASTAGRRLVMLAAAGPGVAGGCARGPAVRRLRDGQGAPQRGLAAGLLAGVTAVAGGGTVDAARMSEQQGEGAARRRGRPGSLTGREFAERDAEGQRWNRAARASVFVGGLALGRPGASSGEMRLADRYQYGPPEPPTSTPIIPGRQPRRPRPTAGDVARADEARSSELGRRPGRTCCCGSSSMRRLARVSAGIRLAGCSSGSSRR